MVKNSNTGAKNNNTGMWVVISLLIVGLLFGGIWMFSGQQTATPGIGGDEPASTNCDLTQKPTITYNDINKYQAGTDPAGALYVITDRIGSIADDGSDSTNFKFYKDYEGLVEYGSTTYFADEISFSTECDSTVTLVPEIYKEGEPTISIINSDGVTKNTDTNHEDVSASDVVELTASVKSPTDECSAVYGAVVVLEYDKTYISKIESNLEGSGHSINYLGHTTNHSATGNDMDGFTVFQFDGKLCDGEKTEFTIKTTQTSETPAEDTNNMKLHWLPINKDLDQDDLTTIIQGVEDEDMNAITIGNTTQTIYTA